MSTESFFSRNHLKSIVSADRIAEAINATVAPIEHQTFGLGAVFTPNEAEEVTMEWYPVHEIVRLETDTMKVLLRRLGEPLIADGHVIFSQQDASGTLRHVSLTHDGQITILQAPHGADEV